MYKIAPIAQLDRVHAFEAWGSRFESWWARSAKRVNCLTRERTRKPERCAASKWRAAPRGGVATEEAEADESCDRVLVGA
ncbi:MAG: hypothetical protein UX94_C0020G0011 [Parcubacteria group bacterium GW2011_GWA2_47_21]|nr:MAG: hypothetical protein UX94_C0020G0011 [Parcubacteria group bacterium GW2011_GWA2_47_21]